MTPLIACLWVFAISCAATWLLALLTREHSWVDRIWSVVPIAYLWIFAGAALFSDVRLTLMAVLVTIWGARLTFNFARKGGYKPGGEDYRWRFLRERMRPWQFQIFSLLFITIYQNAILLLLALPALTVWQHPDTPFGPLDVAVAIVFLALTVGETIADQQQWSFHREKATAAAAGRPSARFLTTGLFRWSRHPNFFFEQAQWWVLYLFACVAAGSLLHWTVLGAFLLTLLFVGSTIFTEHISLSKYPEYADYQARTSPLVPWPPRQRADVGAERASASGTA